MKLIIEVKRVTKLFWHKIKLISLLSSEIHLKHHNKGVKSIYAKTVIQISKIFVIMTMWDLRIQIF